MNNEKEMILNENLWKVCYRLSFPAIIAMVLYGLNVIFDGIFVGRLGIRLACRRGSRLIP